MFSEALKRDFYHESQHLNISKFIDQVRKYHNLDDALSELPEEYLEFYLKNTKLVEKALKRIFESIESPGYVGWSSPEVDVTKNVKYKGEIIRLEYNEEFRQWVPLISFRRITDALKYGKDLIDNYQE